MNDLTTPDLHDSTPASRRRAFLTGVLFSNLMAVTIACTILLLRDLGRFDMGGTVFILLPTLMGVAAAYSWRRTKLTEWQVWKWTTGVFLPALAVFSVILKEGALCLLMVSPLIIAMMFLGVYIGRWLFRVRRPRMNLSLATVALLMFVADFTSPHDHQSLVTDSLIIHASPSAVWPHVVAFPEIKERPSYLFFKVGLPMPASVTVDGYKAGAVRKSIFSNGLAVEEVMTVFEPGRHLVFDVSRQPNDPEIMGHVTMQRGEFILTDNGNGTTTMTVNSWYLLHTYPAWYFDLWAGSIARNVHLRVMEHIRDLSEGTTM
ncbi:MAG: hypothetical protein ABIR47_17955 [Candidatus Kapaibacterium sp.]